MDAKYFRLIFLALLMKIRCDWCLKDPGYMAYHDKEWGVPVHDDAKLFALLILEGMQAGLSWLTILKRRKEIELALCNFDAEKMALMNACDVRALMQNRGIIRNEKKLFSAVKNAKAYLLLQETLGSFARYLWQFTEGKTIQNQWQDVKQIPSSTPSSQKMAQDLKQRGFSYVGSTICYALMQSAGMVNDHIVSCFRHPMLYLKKF